MTIKSSKSFGFPAFLKNFVYNRRRIDDTFSLLEHKILLILVGVNSALSRIHSLYSFSLRVVFMELKIVVLIDGRVKER